MIAEPSMVDHDCVLYVGEALKVLRGLPEQSIQVCVTSPPYWGLRNYGNEGQSGLEETPDQYIDNMVDVFREVRRVLRDDGILWLNIGDSYAADHAQNRNGSERGLHSKIKGADSAREGRPTPSGLKPKDLVGIPWMLAFALRADGWWLRSDCIWDKPNGMPESVTDRPTHSHEFIFMLSKSSRYYFDNEAVKEKAIEGTDMGVLRSVKAADGQGPTDRASIYKRLEKLSDTRKGNPSGLKNMRSVWHIPTGSYPGAHFAVFPPEIPRRCILAGTSEKGCCPDCGAPWKRIIDNPKIPDELRNRSDGSKMDFHTRDVGGGQKIQDWRDANPPQTVGWKPTCFCGHERGPDGEFGGGGPRVPIPCSVLDPFAGSGTVGQVARELNRRSILIELNPSYGEQIMKRTQQLSLLS